MNVQQKKESLQNALVSFKFPKKYFIQSADKRLGLKFAICENAESGGLNMCTAFMTYEELNAFILGYYRGKTNYLKD